MLKFLSNYSLCALLVLSVLTLQTLAQTDASTETTTVNKEETENPQEISYQQLRGTKEYNLEPGYSPFEPTHFAGPKEYNTAGRKLGLANFRIGRVIGTKKSITYTYLFGFTPFVIALKNEVKNPDFVSEQQTPNIAPTKRETSYGFGATPVNFRFTFFPKSKIKPFAQVGAGVLLFNKPLPIPQARTLQFTGDFGGGLIFHNSPNRAWILGYKYFHISNGNFTPKVYNPGFNANVFYIGYSFFR